MPSVDILHGNDVVAACSERLGDIGGELLVEQDPHLIA